MQEELKDVLERAFHTFWQTALIFALAVNDWSDWRVVLAGAAGAGLSAAKTLILTFLRRRKTR